MSAILSDLYRMAATSDEFNRAVDVEISNNTENQFFTSPAVYIYSGYIYNLPTPLINPGKKGDALFVRTSGTACGSVGVLTYAFGHTQFSLLFSNPYDYNLYSTVFAVYIPIEPELTDENLYYKMYYELEPSSYFAKAELSSGSEQIYVSGGNVVISATVTKTGNCSITIRDV
ncbi:DELTA-actitoxin-Aeq1c-like isoform X1 [Chiloscyllium plagiosum]|uniref:DELTA-actitoxin-Aeq1c-like isoform X1 n=2 Tax=Chiloscyllium plagiosum TaxID=36176 RepID=UPI001CB7E287|nr:DELTA-actitoxin-Aeq1c-like isoform X1 [Chiloscyllium plagiosum]